MIDKDHNQVPGTDKNCDTEAYEAFKKLGGDNIGAEQYGCAIHMRNEAQKIITRVFGKIGDIVDDKDAEIHVGRIAERVYAQATNTARALRESLYAEPDDDDNKDDWDR